MAVTPKGRALGIALRGARERRGMSLRDLAAKIDKHCGEISRWENGERTLSPERAAQLLGVLGAGSAEYEEIVSLAQESKNQAWVATTLPERERQMAALIDFERNASQITAVAPLLMPGLLQEPSYIRAIMTAGGGVPESEVPARISVRTRRKESISRGDPVNLSAFIGEAALHQMVGNPEVMRVQLQYLLEKRKRRNIQVRVIPYLGGWQPALEGGFTLIESTRSTPVVQLTNRRSTLFLHENEDIAAYRGAIQQLHPLALDDEGTNRMIRECIGRWERLSCQK